MAKTQGSKGRFCWNELITPDVEGAKKFYSELFGWKLTPSDQGDMHYTMFGLSDAPFGGIMALDPALGAPPHWMYYVTTPDPDAAAKLATDRGGAAVMPPFDAPGTGRFSVIRDPQGAHIAVARFEDPKWDRDLTGNHGEFCWWELHTTSDQGSAGFYEEFFGWSAKSMDVENMRYFVFTREGKDVGGMMPIPEGQNYPPHWLGYVHVASVDTMATKATGLGATLIVPPTDIPGVGRFSVFQDPQGAVLALYTPLAKK